MFGLMVPIFSTPIRSITALLQILFGVVDIYWDMVNTQQPGMPQIISIIFCVEAATKIIGEIYAQALEANGEDVEKAVVDVVVAVAKENVRSP